MFCGFAIRSRESVMDKGFWERENGKVTKNGKFTTF